MRRFVLASAATLLLAAPVSAAEIVGTVVSNDPTEGALVVLGDDGRSTTVRTSETTRIEQDGTVVKTTTLVEGTPVRIVTTDLDTGDMTVTPTASRIVVVPASVQHDDEGGDVDIDDDDDDDLDIDDDGE